VVTVVTVGDGLSIEGIDLKMASSMEKASPSVTREKFPSDFSEGW
jgi:hypothetical protein